MGSESIAHVADIPSSRQKKRVMPKGSPSSKYEHQRTSALLRNIRNIRICMGKKPVVAVTYENGRISMKKQLTLLKMCITSLLWGPRADLWFIYTRSCLHRGTTPQ